MALSDFYEVTKDEVASWITEESVLAASLTLFGGLQFLDLAICSPRFH